MVFNKGFQYIFGDVVDLKIIGYYQGNKKELPFYWFEIISKSVGQSVGKVSLRIGNNYHSYYNGNIGYEVDEEYRGHNYSYYACLMVLEIAKYHKMSKLHIACDCDNVASRKTIEKLNAILLETTVPPKNFVYYYDGIPAQRIYILQLR